MNMTIATAACTHARVCMSAEHISKPTQASPHSPVRARLRPAYFVRNHPAGGEERKAPPCSTAAVRSPREAKGQRVAADCGEVRSAKEAREKRS